MRAASAPVSSCSICQTLSRACLAAPMKPAIWSNGCWNMKTNCRSSVRCVRATKPSSIRETDATTEYRGRTGNAWDSFSGTLRLRRTAPVQTVLGAASGVLRR